MIFKHKGLYLDKSPVHGWGVFIGEDIKKGQLVEECPMASITQITNDYAFIDEHLMRYPITETTALWFIPTGYSILLNQSYTPNLKWSIDVEKRIMYLHAIQDIKANEELFIIYEFEKQ